MTGTSANPAMVGMPRILTDRRQLLAGTFAAGVNTSSVAGLICTSGQQTHSELWRKRCELFRQMNETGTNDQDTQDKLYDESWTLEDLIADTPPKTLRDVEVMVRLAVDEMGEFDGEVLTESAQRSLRAALRALERLPDLSIV